MSDNTSSATGHISPLESIRQANAEGRELWSAREPATREQPCPVCGHPMPDLKGGKDSICPVCGFKDSCCY